jgi:Prophage minor tail protein Z (GPZ)
MGADTRQIPKALNSTINKVARTIRKEGVRQLSKETGIKQKDIRRDVDIRKSNLQTLSARIRATGSHTNIIRFGARQTKKGVSAALWKKRRVFKGAFIANQGRTVFTRKGKGRYPLNRCMAQACPGSYFGIRL